MKSVEKICVVGGVAGGAGFAARMRRLKESARIIMFEKGEYISFANCGLPYHIGNVIESRSDLIIQTPQSFAARTNIDVRTSSEVTSIDTQNRLITVTTPTETYRESYDALLLSPGSVPIRPPIPGIDHPAIFVLRTIPDMDLIRKAAQRRRNGRVVVVGGGFIGLEVAENLRHLEMSVALVEQLDQVFTPVDREMASLIHKQLILNGIELHLSDGVKAFAESGRGDGVTVSLSSGKTVDADFVVLSIGVRPDTAFLANSGIATNDRGAIIVDEHLRTNIPDIYAVGDAVEVTDFVSGIKTTMPLAGPAARQARIAADNIANIPSTYKHTQGTAICKIFDITVAVTGVNEKNALRLGIDHIKSYTFSNSHAAYYPGAQPMSIKLLFTPNHAPDAGRVIGAQIIGNRGVDKRIDVLSEAIRHRLTVNDLTDLELCYAPPFGNSKDAVNIAGCVAQNILAGLHPIVHAQEIDGRDTKTTLLLDVRTEAEHARGAIAGSVNIPLDELRSRIAELDPQKEILTYCHVGLRGYIAARILTSNGLRARNLSGGYTVYSLTRAAR